MFNYEEQVKQAKPMNFIISRLNNQRDYPKAFICFAISGLSFLMSVLNLPSIVLAPSFFTFLFTLSMITLVFGLAFLNGPANYLKKLTDDKKNMFNTFVLAVSIILALYFSVIQGSYLLSLLFCFIEVSNYFP